MPCEAVDLALVNEPSTSASGLFVFCSMIIVVDYCQSFSAMASADSDINVDVSINAL